MERVRLGKRVRLRKQYPYPCDACFDRPGVRGGAAFFDPAQRPTPRQPCSRSSPYPHSEWAGLARGLRRAVGLRYPVRCPVRYLGRFRMQAEFRTNHQRNSKFPRSKCPRSSCPRSSYVGALRRPGLFRRPPGKEHEGGPMQPGLWSSIGTGEIVPPPPYTSAPLRRARRLSPATAPVRMPPWHREFVRKVRPALLLRPYLLSPCGCAPGFAASLPLPSIVAATRPRGQNLSGVLPTIQRRRLVRSSEGRRLKFW
jgi:hypothetical protein